MKVFLRLWIAYCLAQYSVADTIVVTNALDSGEGTLREALTVANSLGDADITFVTGLGSIQLASSLPVVTSSLRIVANPHSKQVIQGCEEVACEEKYYRIFSD
jgi:hypothetical protein